MKIMPFIWGPNFVYSAAINSWISYIIDTKLHAAKSAYENKTSLTKDGILEL